MNRYLVIACLILAFTRVIEGQTDAQKLATASNKFSQKLYQQIALNESQAVYSPFSIHQALAICALGARAETKKELISTLCLNTLSNDSYNEAYKQAINKLEIVRDVIVTSANALFLNPSRTIKNSYKEDVTNFYQALVTNYNLSYPGGPVKEINDFVENKTNGLIKDLLPATAIDQNTLLIIINTLFFNGTWEDTFSESQTQKRDFLTPTGTIKVDTMSDNRDINIKRGYYGANVAQLNFTGEGFSMYFVVPKNTTGLPALEKLLTRADKFENIFTGLTPAYVNFTVPKFKIESQIKLKDALRALGILQAFNETTANFLGITDTNVIISDVIHKALIEVNEKGTVAAAATGIEISVTSLRQPPKESFKVDHPFLFFLVENKPRRVLFQGKFTGQ